MLVIVGTRTDAHSLRNQVGIGSESDCLLGQLDRILRISNSETGLKEEKSGGVVGEEGKCGDDVLRLQERERRRLDILSVKKEAKLSAREMPGVEEGKGKVRCYPAQKATESKRTISALLRPCCFKPNALF